MFESNFTTNIGGDIPTMTVDLTEAIKDHIEEATKNPVGQDKGTDHRWHRGEEVFVTLDAETVRKIRSIPEGAELSQLLYLTQIDTDEEGDLIITATLPD